MNSMVMSFKNYISFGYTDLNEKNQNVKEDFHISFFQNVILIYINIFYSHIYYKSGV